MLQNGSVRLNVEDASALYRLVKTCRTRAECGFAPHYDPSLPDR